MTTLVMVLKMVEIEFTGQGDDFSLEMKNTLAFLSRKNTLGHF